MTAWEWKGDRFEPCVGVPLSDRGFRYGMSVFESLRVKDGRAEFLEDHLTRLRSACAQVGFDPPDFATPSFDPLWKSDGFARIHVTAGDGGPTDDSPAPRTFVTLEPRASETRETFTATIHHGRETPFFGGLKTGNYWPHILAQREARADGFDEALLVSGRSILISACMANVFLVRDGRVVTPALSCGARDGVVRAWVMRQIEVEEAALTTRDAEQADEIFLTNSWLGVMPLSCLAQRPLSSPIISNDLRQVWSARP